MCVLPSTIAMHSADLSEAEHTFGPVSRLLVGPDGAHSQNENAKMALTKEIRRWPLFSLLLGAAR